MMLGCSSGFGEFVLDHLHASVLLVTVVLEAKLEA